MNKATKALRIVFAGTPEFALPPLKALIASDHDVVAVLTQPDRPAGRGKQLRASPVKMLALEHGLDVLQPPTLKDAEWQQRLAELKPDLIVVVAYGLMIPAAVLDLPAISCWNIHASLLPRWRGAAPIHRAVEAGDTLTGVCIMKMEVTLDTGPVLHRVTTPIGSGDTTGILHDRLADMGAGALMQCIARVVDGTLGPAQEQDDELATYAHKLSKAEAQLDWNQPADVLARKVRAFNPWPVAWCNLAGERVRIWSAEALEKDVGCQPGDLVVDGQVLLISTIKGSLKVLELQRAGGTTMTTQQYLNARQSILPGQP